VAFLVSRFKYLVQAMKAKEFLTLSLRALLALLSSNEIVVDSENTVFYSVILWIQWNHVERIPHMASLLACIRFPLMSKYFLLDIVPHVADQFPEKIRDQVMEMRTLGLEAHCSGSARMLVRNLFPASQFAERITDSRKTLTIKFMFINISQMDTTKKIYSAPVFWCGYEFSFFLRPFKLVNSPSVANSPETTEYSLAGFLRCTSKLLPPKHYLPVSYFLRVASREFTSERKFTPSRVIFEAPDKAIGSKLTLPNENLSQIISGESPLVINDTLTVTVDLELLDSDEDCMIITNT